MNTTTLFVSASVQLGDQSVSRLLATELVEHLRELGHTEEVITRDLSGNEAELLTNAHVGAFFTPKEERSAKQRSLLQQSDTYLEEVKCADTLIIATPMYNFSVPAVLKAWIDLICRAGESFRYTSEGPQGLLAGKKAYLVVTTGGVPVGSGTDFLVPYLKQIMQFIGIHEIQVIAADGLKSATKSTLARARTQIKRIK